MKCLVFILVFLAFAPACLHAQFATGGTAVSIQGFTLSGIDERGLPWRLRGTETQSNGYYITIHGFQLDFELKKQQKANEILGATPDGELNVHLESDTCNLNSATQEIKSTAPVKITIGRNVTVTGIGYDVDLRHKVILIRSTVFIKLPMKKNIPSAANIIKKDKMK